VGTGRVWHRERCRCPVIASSRRACTLALADYALANASARHLATPAITAHSPYTLDTGRPNAATLLKVHTSRRIKV